MHALALEAIAINNATVTIFQFISGPPRRVSTRARARHIRRPGAVRMHYTFAQFPQRAPPLLRPAIYAFE
ncbi:MAG TPA: hypothetical protein VFO14_11490 [Vicinamibacterales bacterium]|jgi:hypothetical protein|nr:hypothetical protein [Vicinamibacterales bacterium]